MAENRLRESRKLSLASDNAENVFVDVDAQLLAARSFMNDPKKSSIVNEELDEDEAFNTEDEEEFGHMFKSNKAASYCANEEDGSEQLVDLSTLMDDAEGFEEQQPSKAAGEGQDLTLNDLLQPVSSKAGWETAKMQANYLGKNQGASKVLSAQLGVAEEAKVDRAEARLKVKHDMRKWVGFVRKQRQSETVSFPRNEVPSQNVTAASMLTTHGAETKMEQEIDDILKEGGLDVETVKKEVDDLGAGKISAEDMKKRSGELARMRGLLFYQEQKNKRWAKIKSKTFKKHRKHDKEKKISEMRDIDPELDARLKAKEERAAARAKISLRYKNTSKYLNRELHKTGSVAGGTRSEVVEHIRENQALEAKQLSMQYSDDSSGEDSDDAGDEGGAAIGTTEEKYALLGKQKRQLQAAMRDDDGAKIPQNSVFNMAFMQKAAMKRKEEAKQLLAEIEEEEARSLDTSDGVAPKVLRPRAGTSSQATRSLATEKGDEEVAEGRRSYGGTAQRPAPTKEVDPDLDHFEHSDEEDGSADIDKVVPVSRGHEKDRKLTDTDFLSTVDSVARGGGASVSSLPDDEVIEVGTGPEGETGDDPVSMEQQDLIGRTFASAVTKEDFIKEKADIVESQLPQDDTVVLPGWGDWTATLEPPKKLPRYARDAKLKHAALVKAALLNRRDARSDNLILNERKDKKFEKYTVKSVPWPYVSKDNFELTTRMPLGPEWQSSASFERSIRPKVSVKVGHAIQPAKWSKEVQNAGREKKSEQIVTKGAAKSMQTQMKRRRGLNG